MIEGEGPAPSLVIPLIAGLPDTSMLHAMRRGGIHMLGRGEDREIAASIFDAIQLNTKATGNWKKSPPDLPTWPKPKAPETKKKRRSLAELHASFFK